MIYLDNAATTYIKPRSVTEAVIGAMEGMGNASRGGHSGTLAASRVIYGARCKAAEFFGCGDPSSVVFTCNSTEALNIAISGLFSKGDHVISTDMEHNSVLRPLYRLEAERGVTLSFVRADGEGRIDYADIERLIRPNTRGIVCNFASNLTGDAADMETAGAIAKKRGILLIADASQAAGSMDIDMEKLGISVLCWTGHKGLYGPQGTGGMCIAPGVDIRPFKVGGSGIHSFSRTQPEQYPARLEAGTLNGHGIAGLSAAFDFINETGIEAVRAKETALMRRFYERVRLIPSVKVYGDFSKQARAPIVALNIADSDSSAVSDALSEEFGIATRAGAHCAPRLHEALGTAEQGAVRFSFSYFNSEEDADAAAAAVEELAEGGKC